MQHTTHGTAYRFIALAHFTPSKLPNCKSLSQQEQVTAISWKAASQDSCVSASHSCCCITPHQTCHKGWRHAGSLSNTEDRGLLRSLISESVHQSLYWNARLLPHPVMTLDWQAQLAGIMALPKHQTWQKVNTSSLCWDSTDWHCFVNISFWLMKRLKIRCSICGYLCFIVLLVIHYLNTSAMASLFWPWGHANISLAAGGILSWLKSATSLLSAT